MPRAIDYHTKCLASVKEFLTFAKGLAKQRGQCSLDALAVNPAASLFAKRLADEALGGEAHAPACLNLIAHFAQDPSWAEQFRAASPAGHPPSHTQIRPRDLEPVARGIPLILPATDALRWIATAYLSGKGSPETRSAIQKQLVDTAVTLGSLLEALSIALHAVSSNAKPIPPCVRSRATDAITHYAAMRFPDAYKQATQSPLLRLLTGAKRPELTRLAAALLSLQSDALGSAPTNHAPTFEAPSPKLEDLVAEAAWIQADDALARALQNSAALKHALDRAGEIDPGVRGYARLVTQAVHTAASKRELELEDGIGATILYNPQAHDSDEPITGPDVVVRIQKPAVAQGKKHYRRILRKAEVVPT